MRESTTPVDVRPSDAVQGADARSLVAPRSSSESPRHAHPLVVALVALLGYLLIFLVFYTNHPDLRDFIILGRDYVARSHASPVISLDPKYAYSELGYDGEFAYFIAADPATAPYYVDNPAYRYMRILYPATARLVAVGNPAWVPASLLIVNLLAITAGTWAIAAWCRRRGLSPWLALVYTFYVGQVLVFTRDLNDALAYALVALGVYLFDFGPRNRLPAAVLFALAGLARETTLVFAALYAVRFAFERDSEDERGRSVVRAGGFAAVAFLPAMVWQALLFVRFGALPALLGHGLVWVPLSGVYGLYRLTPDAVDVVQLVVVPGVICLVVAAYYVARSSLSRGRVEVWALAANALLFVVLLPGASLVELYAAARVATPVVMGAIYSLCFVPRRGWLYLCAGLWLAATVGYLANPLLQLLHGS